MLWEVTPGIQFRRMGQGWWRPWGKDGEEPFTSLVEGARASLSYALPKFVPVVHLHFSFPPNSSLSPGLLGRYWTTRAVAAKCGPQISSNSVFWANSGALPQTYRIRNSGSGTLVICITRALQVVITHDKVWEWVDWRNIWMQGAGVCSFTSVLNKRW